MYTYEVKTRFGTFYVPADDWSISPNKETVLFWTGKRITRQFKVNELEAEPQSSITRSDRNPNRESAR